MLRGILNIIFLGAVSEVFSVSYATLPLTEDFESSTPSLDSYWTTSFDNSTSGRLESRALVGSYPMFATTNSQKGSGYDATLTAPTGNGLVAYNSSSLSSINYSNADLHLNLANKGGVTVVFHAVDVGSAFSGNNIRIYLSTDGGSSFGATYQNVNMNSTPYNDGKWNTITVDVSALATSNGFTLTSTSVVRLNFNIKGLGDLSSPRTSEQMIFLDNLKATYTTILPVELTSFVGENVSSMNILKWTTATEINNYYFEVQKSKDGVNFGTIAKINGQGTTSNFTNYIFEDTENINETNYYRLLQVDYDGKSEYSKVISVNNSVAAKVQVYPNPSTDGKITLSTNAFENQMINVYDMNGKLVQTHVVTGATSTLELSPSSSLYYISYFDGVAMQSIKVAIY